MRTNNNSSRATTGNNKWKWILPTIVIVGVSLWFIFKPGPEPGPIPDQYTDCNPIKPQAPSQSVLFFDNSKSMKGYLDGTGSNLFIDVMSDLSSIYPTMVMVGNDELTRGAFIDSLVKKKISWSGESLLYKVFKEMVSCIESEQVPIVSDSNSFISNASTICFFVTDGILSHSSTEITKREDINIKKKKELQNLVSDVFKDHDSIGVSVYQFCSDFNGVYYCYDNDNKPIKCPRYYYVLAIGRPSALSDFKSRLSTKQRTESNFTFVPNNQWHAIDNLPLSSPLSLPSVFRMDTNNNNHYTYHRKTFPKNGVEARIPVKLFHNHAFDSIQVLAQNTRIYFGNRLMKFDVNYDIHDSSLFFHIDKNDLESHTTQVRVVIDYPHLQWIKESSNIDDHYIIKNPLLKDERTFLLEYLINGIRNGLEYNNSTLFETTLLLTNIDS